MPTTRKSAFIPVLALTLGALLVIVHTPAAASDGDRLESDLGPYFERLRMAPPAQRVAVRSYAAAHPMRPAHRVAYSTPGTLDIATLERTVFNHINLHRVAKGMRPLGEHGGLASTARGHSTNMATGSAPMSHDGMRGRLMQHMGHFGRNAGGEILAYNRGAGDPAQTAMRSWLNSYRHKDVIEEDYTNMGVGIAMRADGAYYFTVLFIR